MNWNQWRDWIKRYGNRVVPGIVVILLLVWILRFTDWSRILPGSDNDPVVTGRFAVLAVWLVIYAGVAWLLKQRLKIQGIDLLWAFMGTIITLWLVMTVRGENPLYVLSTHVLDTPAPFNVTNFDVPVDEIDPDITAPALPFVFNTGTAFLEQNPSHTARLSAPVLWQQCVRLALNDSLSDLSAVQLAAAWLTVLLPIFVVLTVLPACGLLHTATGNTSAILWYPLTAGIMVYPHSPAVIALFLVTLAMWLLYQERMILAAIAGIVVGVAVWFNLTLVTFVPVVLFYSFHARHHAFKTPITRSSALLFGVFAVVGAVAVMPIIELNLYPALVQFFQTKPRHMVAFGLLPVGAALSTLILCGIAVVAVTLREFIGTRPPEITAAAFITMVTASVAIFFNISTTHEHPLGLWLQYLVPLMLVAATQFIVRRPRLWITITAVQIVVVLATVGLWDTFSKSDAATQPPVVPQRVQVSQPFNANVDTLALNGWDSRIEGEEVVLTLNLQSQAVQTDAHWFSVLLVNENGNVASESVVWKPHQADYPQTCWRQGETISTDVRVGVTAPSTSLFASVAIYSEQDAPVESRLEITLPDGTTDTQVGIGPMPAPQIEGE